MISVHPPRNYVETPNTNIQKGLLGNQPTLGQNKDPKEPPEPISGRKKPIGKKKLQEQVL